MRDFFIETIALERIELITRLVSLNQCEAHDHEVALEWVAELMADVLSKFESQEKIGGK